MKAYQKVEARMAARNLDPEQAAKLMDEANTNGELSDDSDEQPDADTATQEERSEYENALCLLGVSRSDPFSEVHEQYEVLLKSFT